MQQVAQIFKDNKDGGAFIITSSVAVSLIIPKISKEDLSKCAHLSCVLIFKGTTVSGSSMGYCVTKAAGLRLMKCLASTQGPKIRVNAVLPGLLLTEWVSR